MNFIKSCIIYIIAVVLLSLLLALASSSQKVLAPEFAEASTYQSPDALDVWMDKLAWCESRGNPKALNPHDPVTPSYGLFQFKQDTFYRYNLVFGLYPSLEMAEVLNVIYDPVSQKALAKAIILAGGAGNWVNCVKAIGQPPI